MACFLVPAAEAAITSAARMLIVKYEEKNGDKSVLRSSEKIGRLNKMLWGGSALLAFEHVWHGEITPFFPFLTAASDPVETEQMLHEMVSTGTAMAVLVTLVWICMEIVITAAQKQKRCSSDMVKEGAEQ